ncbi:hypothetical protein VCHA53O466_140097 [Vibrio chagasii]|nr:hypothetical protein VCHA53O466_140097 [Vibrio chagasii]
MNTLNFEMVQSVSSSNAINARALDLISDDTVLAKISETNDGNWKLNILPLHSCYGTRPNALFKVTNTAIEKTLKQFDFNGEGHNTFNSLSSAKADAEKRINECAKLNERAIEVLKSDLSTLETPNYSYNDAEYQRRAWVTINCKDNTTKETMEIVGEFTTDELAKIQYHHHHGSFSSKPRGYFFSEINPVEKASEFNAEGYTKRSQDWKAATAGCSEERPFATITYGTKGCQFRISNGYKSTSFSSMSRWKL